MRYNELRYDPKKAYRANDRAELKKAAGFYTEAEFINHIAGRKTEPRTSYTGYDAAGTAIASFDDPSRGDRYARVERHDPSRQALASYRRYLQFREQLQALYADLQRERGDDFMALHSFDFDDIEVVGRLDGTYDARVRGRLVGRALVNVSAEPGMSPDSRTIFKVAVNADDRRQGVARKMYQQIERDLAAKGLHLMPSKARTDDAKLFWKRYRPDA